jgi:protocatechuate 3,4-dioxygenase beta subunit
VYAYQTDATGVYPQAPALSGAAARHGQLRAWARTDDSGRYTFRTVRPAAYPQSTIPQHIHLHVIEPQRCTYYIGDVLFDDDPLLTQALRIIEARAFGGNGIVIPIKLSSGSWRATRDIVVGANVPNYGDCSVRRPHANETL